MNLEFTLNDLTNVIKSRNHEDYLFEQTKDRPLKVLGTDYYTSSPVSFGNHKLDDRIGYNALYPGKSCLCGLCDGCYAKKACKFHFQVDYKYAIDNYIACNDMNSYMQGIYDAIDIAIKQGKIDAFRFHESGDFFSQDYLDKWVDLVQCFPGLKFYGYTGVESFLDFSKFKSLYNVNLVNSILPDGKRNFDVKEVIVPRAKALGVHVCGYEKGSGLKCGFCKGQCNKCFFQKYIAFIKH